VPCGHARFCASCVDRIVDILSCNFMSCIFMSCIFRLCTFMPYTCGPSFSCPAISALHIGPSFSRPAISCLANSSKIVPSISCPAISCLAILMVRHFHVLHFQSTLVNVKGSGGWEGHIVSAILNANIPVLLNVQYRYQWTVCGR